MTSPPRFTESGRGVQLGFDELDTPLARHHLRRRRPRNHRGPAPATTRSPRSARSRSAAERSSASSRRWSTPGVRSHRTSSSSPASPPRWCTPRRRSTRCCRRFSSSPRVRYSSPTTPDSTSVSSRPRPPTAARPWPRFPVVCTVKLARRVLGRDEAPSVKLSALAQLFHVSTQPTHRALDDARATVDVLHALIERVGNHGVHSLTELRRLPPRRHQRTTGQAHARRAPAPATGCLPVPRPVGRSALRRHRRRSPPPGPLLLHRVGDARPA